MEIKWFVLGEGLELGLGCCILKCFFGIVFVLIYVYIIYIWKKNCGDDFLFFCEKVFMWLRFWYEMIYSVFFVMLFDKVCI